jgi:hypothetical protein
MRALARGLFGSPEYRASVTRRLLAGKAPQLEVLLYYYAYGKPVTTVEMAGQVTPDFRAIPGTARETHCLPHSGGSAYWWRT